MHKIAIIGAGLAGLSAAIRLKQNLGARCEITIFDKSRGVGGRMSTRYADAYEFDHGAQYFTVTSPEFSDFLQPYIRQGDVARWDARALYLKNGILETDRGGIRFVATPRMNSLCKALAAPFQVHLAHRVKKISRGADGIWTLKFETQDHHTGFHQLILAIPSVQALDLISSDDANRAAIEKTRMVACFALMVGAENLPDFGWDTLRVNGLPIDWLSINSAKPGRKKNVATLMVHAAPEWSDSYVNANREDVQSIIEDSVSMLLNWEIKQAPHRVLHRWLYASVTDNPDVPCFYNSQTGLGICGDWCLGGRVEGAFQSGVALAQICTKHV